jgi:hypothetical protein
MPRTERLLMVRQWIIRTLLLLLLAAALLAQYGCAQQVKPVAPVTPKVVTQTVTQYVSVPADLTTACPIEQPQSRTVSEAVRVARARKDSLVQCNKQLEAIRSLGGSP